MSQELPKAEGLTVGIGVPVEAREPGRREDVLRQVDRQARLREGQEARHGRRRADSSAPMKQTVANGIMLNGDHPHDRPADGGRHRERVHHGKIAGEVAARRSRQTAHEGVPPDLRERLAGEAGQLRNWLAKEKLVGLHGRDLRQDRGRADRATRLEKLSVLNILKSGSATKYPEVTKEFEAFL